MLEQSILVTPNDAAHCLYRGCNGCIDDSCNLADRIEWYWDAQGPRELLAKAALMGDLFPEEWPPAGASKRAGQPHLPPSAMPARAAMARR